jgi:hypothetical protein
LRKLKDQGVPEGYRLLHYPDLPLLESYPTLGPQSDDRVHMDVNGMAGSLEMYLGRDLLTVDGDLVPVHWEGPGGGKGRRKYQGALSSREKARIQDAFRRKVAVARRDPTMLATQDWSGVTAIVETILTAFD